MRAEEDESPTHPERSPGLARIDLWDLGLAVRAHRNEIVAPHDGTRHRHLLSVHHYLPDWGFPATRSSRGLGASRAHSAHPTTASARTWRVPGSRGQPARDDNGAAQSVHSSQFRYKGKREAVLANLRGDALQDATSCYRSVGEQGIPLLLTLGSLDQMIPPESITRLRELLPEIEYHEFEDAAHLAHYESPDQVNRLLIGFLAD